MQSYLAEMEFRDGTIRKSAVAAAEALVLTVSCGVAGKVPVQSKQSTTGTELVGLVSSVDWKRLREKR